MANSISKKQKAKKRKVNGEFAIYFTLLLILLAIPVSNVYTKAILSESNIALDQIKSDIKEQENMNESLKMEISELASLDTIQEIVEANSLTYQNKNVRVVTNE